MTTQPESKLSREIMAALRDRGIFCFKVHGGPMTMAGLPDIIACMPLHLDLTGIPLATTGRFVGIETKMPGGVVTPIQAHRHEQIRAAGGIVVVAHSVTEALNCLGVTDTTPDV